MTKVLVMGASRGIGLETVKALLARGLEVRAFARSASGIAIDDPKLETFDGDALHAGSVERGLAGIDVVVQSLGVTFGPEVVLKGTTLFSKATRVLVDAMRKTGVKRLVAVTGAGAGDSRGHGGILFDRIVFPLVLKRVYDDKDVQEQIIKASGLKWTIARPGGLTGGAATGLYNVLTDPDTWRGGFIARADVADFLVKEVLEPAYVNQTPVLIS
jgi:putative NADH-flavin reductase